MPSTTNTESVSVCLCTWSQRWVRQPRGSGITGVQCKERNHCQSSSPPEALLPACGWFLNAARSGVTADCELTCTQRVARRCTACRRARTWPPCLPDAARRCAVSRGRRKAAADPACVHRYTDLEGDVVAIVGPET